MHVTGHQSCILQGISHACLRVSVMHVKGRQSCIPKGISHVYQVLSVMQALHRYACLADPPVALPMHICDALKLICMCVCR